MTTDKTAKLFDQELVLVAKVDIPLADGELAPEILIYDGRFFVHRTGGKHYPEHYLEGRCWPVREPLDGTPRAVPGVPIATEDTDTMARIIDV